jgi:serine/threonine-protein kinase
VRIEAGSLFAGYTVVKQLGRGGMATVYLVREPGINRLVALKVLPEQLVDDSHFAARFEQEAQVIGSLDHPNIIPLYRYGITDDVPWMALRYVDGGDFAARLASHPLPLPEGLSLLRGVASALDYAHRKGVIHRDLKPQNILLTGDGAVYLADFGVAKLLEGTLRLKTATGSVMGTPAYMAPEQAKGAQLGPYTDVYALAVICFQWLTGSLPFDADTPYAILLKHVMDPLPPGPLGLLAPNVAAVLERGLAKQPEDRFQASSTLIAQLEHALYAPTTQSLPAVSTQQHRADPSLRIERVHGAAIAAMGPKHWWKSVALVALALVLSIGGYAYWHEVMQPAAEQRAVQQRAADEAAAKQVADAASARRVADEAAAAKQSLEKREAEKRTADEAMARRAAEKPMTDTAAARAAEDKRIADKLATAKREAEKRVSDDAAAEKRVADAAASKAAEERRAADKLAADAAATKLAEAQQATLIVKTDAACELSVNGEAKGMLQVNKAMTLKLPPGEQLIECASSEGSGSKAQETKSVSAGSQAVVVLALLEKIAGKQREGQMRIAAETASRNPQNLGFVDLGSGVLKDTKTGLEWMQSDNRSNINGNDAKTYCESNAGG